ncbi:MAG: fluoride efflux transporter CrcB [Bacteroidetes bacterium]|nr:fluoride efflux transporter CrcB [Bacteroidota bacterium]
MTLLTIFIGGGLGAVSRYLAGSWVNRLMGPEFPWGTLLVNVAGSFIIGFFLTWMEHRLPVFPYWRPLIAIGFLGGFTTFSSFSWETVVLLRNGDYLLAALNTGGSVLLCLTGVILGIWLARPAGG